MTNNNMDIVPHVSAVTEAPRSQTVEIAPHSSKLGRGRLALAVAVAVVSDALAFFVALAPPLEWALDIATALSLFLILGRRWAILPGLVAEAIPGIAIFPAWILVVGSIILYDDIKGRKKV
jgi:hypothetical protein